MPARAGRKKSKTTKRSAPRAGVRKKPAAKTKLAASAKRISKQKKIVSTSAASSTAPARGAAGKAWHLEYGVHPGIRMMVDWIASLKEKTGRSLGEWMSYIRKEGPEGEESRRHWLKEKHALGTNSAWWLAERSVGKGGGDDSAEAYLAAATRYVDEMYAGAKSALRPLHDALIKLGYRVANDVRACPCQTIVPLYRQHVIAQIKPGTRTRIDLGLALGAMMKSGETKFPARLIDTGGFAKKDRITHRIEITSMDDIDEEVERWMKRAYELDA